MLLKNILELDTNELLKQSQIHFSSPFKRQKMLGLEIEEGTVDYIIPTQLKKDFMKLFKLYVNLLLKNNTISFIDYEHTIIYDFLREYGFSVFQINEEPFSKINFNNFLKNNHSSHYFRKTINNKEYIFVQNFRVFYIAKTPIQVEVNKHFNKLYYIDSDSNNKPTSYFLRKKIKGLNHPLIYNSETHNIYIDNEYDIENLYNSIEVIYKKIEILDKSFYSKLKNEIKLMFNPYLKNYNPLYYAGMAYKKKQHIIIYTLPKYVYNYDEDKVIRNKAIERLITHEIGHFYYWEHANKSFNSKKFFSLFKEHYNEIKELYGSKVYYFRYSPFEKQKFTKSAEYFCEMFSLFLSGDLNDKYTNLFEEFFVY